MAKLKFTEKEIKQILEYSKNQPVSKTIKEQGISYGTFYRWKERYGNEVEKMTRNTNLERENEKLKIMLAEMLLEKHEKHCMI